MIGLDPKIANKETLLKKEYLGQYGKITKIIVNSNKVYNPTNSTQGPSYSAYINYSTDQEAALAILSIDSTLFNGKQIKAAFGTTKYCSYYLKKVNCSNKECVYIHSVQDKSNIISKENTEFYIEQHKLAYKVADITNTKIKDILYSKRNEEGVFPNPYSVYFKKHVINQLKADGFDNFVIGNSNPPNINTFGAVNTHSNNRYNGFSGYIQGSYNNTKTRGGYSTSAVSNNRYNNDNTGNIAISNFNDNNKKNYDNGNEVTENKGYHKADLSEIFEKKNDVKIQKSNNNNNYSNTNHINENHNSNLNINIEGNNNSGKKNISISNVNYKSVNSHQKEESYITKTILKEINYDNNNNSNNKDNDVYTNKNEIENSIDNDNHDKESKEESVKEKEKELDTNNIHKKDNNAFNQDENDTFTEDFKEFIEDNDIIKSIVDRSNSKSRGNSSVKESQYKSSIIKRNDLNNKEENNDIASDINNISHKNSKLSTRVNSKDVINKQKNKSKEDDFNRDSNKSTFCAVFNTYYSLFKLSSKSKFNFNNINSIKDKDIDINNNASDCNNKDSTIHEFKDDSTYLSKFLQQYYLRQPFSNLVNNLDRSNKNANNNNNIYINTEKKYYNVNSIEEEYFNKLYKNLTTNYVLNNDSHNNNNLQYKQNKE